MSSSSVAPVESSIKKHKRVRVKKACTNCRLAKTCCSASRPCIRCTRLGLEANCRDLTPQGAEDMVSSSSTPHVLSDKEVQDVEFMKQYVGGYRPASASDVSRNQTEIPVPFDWVMSSILNNQHVPAVPFSRPQQPPSSHLPSANRSAPAPVPSPSFSSASAPFAFMPASTQPVSSISSNIQYYQHYQQQQQPQTQQQQQPQVQSQQQEQVQQPQIYQQSQQQQQQQSQSQRTLSDSSSSSSGSSSGCPLEMSDFSSTTVFDTDARNRTIPAESHEDSFAPNSPPGVVPSADSPDLSAPNDMRCPDEPTPAYFMRRFINQQQKQRQEEQKQQQQGQGQSSSQSSQQPQNLQEGFHNNPVKLNVNNITTGTTTVGSSVSAPQMADVSSYLKQDPSFSSSLSAINSSNVIGSGAYSTSLKDSPSSVCVAHTTTTPAYFGMVGATDDQMIMLPPNVVREIELLRNENLSLRDKVSQLMYKLEISRLSNSSWYRDTLMTNPAHLAYSTWLFPTSVLLDYNDYFFENLRPELKPLAKARQMTCKVLFLPRHTPKCSRILTWLGKGLARYLEVEQLWWKDDREIAVISSVRIQYNDEGHPVRLDMISQHRPHVLVPAVDSPEYDRFFTPLAVEAPALEHLFQLASQEQERSPHLTPKAITDSSPFFSIDPCRSFADD